MNRKILFTTLIALLLYSCSSSKFITTGDAYTSLKLNLSSDSIAVIDERSLISQEEDIRLPIISVPNQVHVFYPKLKPTYVNIVHTTVIENLAKKDSVLNSKLTIYVLEAQKKFIATMWSEQEWVFIKLKLVVETAGVKTEIVESGEFFTKSMDAKPYSFEKLFQKSLKEVTYNGLRKLKK